MLPLLLEDPLPPVPDPVVPFALVEFGDLSFPLPRSTEFLLSDELTRLFCLSPPGLWLEKLFFTSFLSFSFSLLSLFTSFFVSFLSKTSLLSDAVSHSSLAKSEEFCFVSCGFLGGRLPAEELPPPRFPPLPRPRPRSTYPPLPPPPPLSLNPPRPRLPLPPLANLGGGALRSNRPNSFLQN